MPQHSTLSYNQQGENTSRRNLGRNMWGACQSMGTEDEAYDLRVNSLAEVPQIGDTHKDAIITTVSVKLDSTESLNVSITASKNFNRINEYLGIDQRYRQWAIPAEGITKELHWSEYCIISDEERADLPAALFNNIFRATFIAVFTPTSDLGKVGAAAMEIMGEPNSRTYLPVTAGAFGDSLLFAAQTQDNYSAGKSSVWNNSRVEYVDKPYSVNGATTVQRFMLAKGLTQAERTESLGTGWALPAFAGADAPSDVCFDSYFEVNKDPAEQVNFNVQLHIAADIPALIIGELTTENNPLVKEGIRELKLWLLKKKISKFAQIITEEEGTEVETALLGVEYSDPPKLQILVPPGADGVGWAITDEAGRLYLAENDVSKFAQGPPIPGYPFSYRRMLIFNFSPER